MTRRILRHIPEPLLEFGHGQCEEHPKDGLYLYGPPEAGDVRGALKYGLVGTGAGIELFQKWKKLVTSYIPAFKDGVAHHSAFPGYEALFGMAWPEKAVGEVRVDNQQLDHAIRIDNRHEATKKCVDIYAEAIADFLSQEADVTPELWFVIVPKDVYRWGRTNMSPPVSERVRGKARMGAKLARTFLATPSFFEEDNAEAELQLYDLNFHNQLKARLLGKAVVQIIRETTLIEASTPDTQLEKRTTQDPATVAWNLCTTTYFKTAGPPWRLRDIRHSVCYVGIVFKKDTADPKGRNACCGAQLFLRSGDGLVFRGAVGPWYSAQLKQCHLPADKATGLMQLVLDGYKRIHGEYPKEIFIHGRSRFDRAEWEGFSNACPQGTKIVGIRIRASDELKLYRLAHQPVIRGTYCEVTPKRAYLWTKGYVARFNTYPGFEVPNPLAINIDWGEADMNTVLADILALTKVNFNGCTFADGLPVTLKFANAIGEILTAAPDLEKAPQPFKYYI
jgi:hypothetical protein